MGYLEKVFGLSAVLDPVSDHRAQPRIPTALVVKSALIMFWCRLGSLHALEMSARAKFWREWLGGAWCSADSMGRIAAGMQSDTLRRAMHSIYGRLKRNKVLLDLYGLGVAVLDGHETSASYRRCCTGCLQRTLHTAQGDRIQFYHRNVTLLLLCRTPPGRPPIRLLLDLEPQRPAETEVATALRLLQRVLTHYPRAFDLVLADALYDVAPFLNFLSQHGKYALVVLKDERRNAYQDVAGLWPQMEPHRGQYRSRRCCWWDVAELTSWPEIEGSVRIVRWEETWTVKRQLTQQVEEQTAHWIWLTTLPVTRAGTASIVRLGHMRWDIENYGFNELVNGWHSNHVYRHREPAIECFLLLVFLAYNLFHAFLALNLKPQVRQGKTATFWVRLLCAEIHSHPPVCTSGSFP